LPLFKPSPTVYRLLDDALPAHVPHLLASRLEGVQTWVLFAPFVSETVRSVGTFDSLHIGSIANPHAGVVRGTGTAGLGSFYRSSRPTYRE
jgi:hypothetical protein